MQSNQEPHRIQPYFHITLSFATLHWLFALAKITVPRVNDILGTQKHKRVLPHKGHAGQMRTHTHRTVCLVTVKGVKEFTSGEK